MNLIDALEQFGVKMVYEDKWLTLEGAPGAKTFVVRKKFPRAHSPQILIDTGDEQAAVYQLING